MLVLASSSPRRRHLLSEAGISFEVDVPQVQELAGPEWTAHALCVANAELKARDTAARFPGRVVLGSDTVVSLDDEVFGKPRDLDEARSMLSRLSGRIHEVLTGVCLFLRAEEKMCLFVESTRVKFRDRASVDLEAYLADVHVLDKAGAYAAQEDQGRLIECIEGSMSNVVGLPVERVEAALRLHFPDLLAG